LGGAMTNSDIFWFPNLEALLSYPVDGPAQDRDRDFPSRQCLALGEKEPSNKKRPARGVTGRYF
jgi:hypothetical protein